MSGPELECATPEKRRYATRTAAMTGVKRAALTLGKDLYPYACACGWYHLASDVPKSNVALSANGKQLTSEEFRAIVRSDVVGRAAKEDSELIRRDENLRHWDDELKLFWMHLQTQYAEHKGDKSREAGEWRRRTARVEHSLRERREEVRRLRQDFRNRNADKRQARRQLRRDAGEGAIKRLIEAHREEFEQYLAEELKTETVDIPQQLQRYVALRQAEGKERDDDYDG